MKMKTYAVIRENRYSESELFLFATKKEALAWAADYWESVEKRIYGSNDRELRENLKAFFVCKVAFKAPAFGADGENYSNVDWNSVEIVKPYMKPPSDDADEALFALREAIEYVGDAASWNMYNEDDQLWGIINTSSDCGDNELMEALHEAGLPPLEWECDMKDYWTRSTVEFDFLEDPDGEWSDIDRSDLEQVEARDIAMEDAKLNALNDLDDLMRKWRAAAINYLRGIDNEFRTFYGD
jgi:hypothetical protein